ncbi:MAG: asparagine synthase (glutamine-hydrolyzing) [Candidatus Rokubacteria bacterium]|nr:asparagine synthase (glutamine-hydrolyzing) [Candidatus Rokubacteria bacterium]
MCGIAGIVLSDRGRTVDEPVLGRMTDVLRHRGPDDRGVNVWGNVGFGHRRLSIVDLEGGHQPMSSADGTLWVTFNGELYNYVELRAELIQHGYRLKTYSDTEVLLALYDRYGLRMFEHMNGMFAFALWDARARRLVLARDRFGEKPLYWYRDRERVLFASEIKAILAVPGVRAAADPAAVQEYLTFQYCLAERTLFDGVHRLPPASYLVLDDTGAEIERGEYWSLGYEEDHARSEEYWVDELRFLLEDAVKIRLRSDVPVGTYLSGGVDSSVVTALAAKLMGRGLPAFTGYFAEGDRFSELPYAEAVAKQHGCPHHVTCPSAQDFADNLGRIIYHMDEPAAGPGAFPQLMVSGLARRAVTVVLGGQGGDELFGGYARYLLMYLEESLKGSIFQSQDPARHIVTLGRALPNLAMLQQYVPLLKDFWSQGLFGPVERRYFALITRIPELAQYFTPGFLAARDDAAIYAGFEAQFNDVLRHVSTGGSALFNRMTAYDVRTLLQSLLHVEDRMSMAVSLESRLPLLDYRIAELMFRMPPLYKYRDGKSKSVLLAATRSLLPETVRERKDKMGFPVPFVEWARGPLKGFVSDILLGQAARERGIYRMDGLARLLESERPFGRELWGLLCLELWFRTFLDGTGTAVSWPA